MCFTLPPSLMGSGFILWQYCSQTITVQTNGMKKWTSLEGDGIPKNVLAVINYVKVRECYDKLSACFPWRRMGNGGILHTLNCGTRFGKWSASCPNCFSIREGMNDRLESVHKNIERRTRRWSDALGVLLLQHSWQFYYADCFEFFCVCSWKLKKYAY